MFGDFCLVYVGLLARSQYPGGFATGHLDTGFETGHLDTGFATGHLDTSFATGHLDTGFLRFLCLQTKAQTVSKFEVARAASPAAPTF
jgi:hypothetical protein